MKIRNYITVSILSLGIFAACSQADEKIAFGIDTNTISVDAVGGVKKVKVSASENWVATSNVPWISVSPANGDKSQECSLNIDSAITNTVRNGVVRIVKVDNKAEYQEIKIEQKGFDYAITLDEPSVEIENYASLDKRYFDVRVKTNVDFDVQIPDSVSNWVKVEQYEVDLNHGIRPREVNVRFTWGINSRDQVRSAEVLFAPSKDSPVTSDMLVRNDRLYINQGAAEPIERGTRAGDSVALLSISRTLEVWSSDWESSGEKMDNWDGVTLWEEGMAGYVDSLKGRVKSAEFYMFSTKEGIPVEVQYLTGAEELTFYSNTNTFQLNLSCGEYICKLTQLKRLTIGAYGLTELHPDFTKLSNLEYLDLGSNNFERVPEILTPDNFPKLHALRMANNQRRLVYDLSNNILTNFGGLYQHTKYDSKTQTFGEFPTWLLKWEANEAKGVTGLDTLILSVNYLQGSIPSFEDDPDVGYYTQEDINQADTLPQYLADPATRVKRVMPQLKLFAVNLNRLTGELPRWVLYHPALDWWDPYTLFFTQEGKDEQGNQAKFSNEPANLNYYYDVYTKKEMANATDDSESGSDTGTKR